MAAQNYVLFIPRANYAPGTGGYGKGPAGSSGQNQDPSAAAMAGTRPPFIVDTTLWSSITLFAPSPYRTVGRQVVLIGDAAWRITHLSTDTPISTGFPVAANQGFTIEIGQERDVFYVAAASGSVNINAWVVR